MPDDTAVEQMLTTLAEVERGNLRARVALPSDTPEKLKTLSHGIDRLIDALRASEIRARKIKRAFEEQAGIVEAQAIAIRELATPILQIWRGTLLLPLVGKLDDTRHADIMGELLERVITTQSRHVIIDVTGTEIVDEAIADQLIKLARAVELVGARAVVTGISPSVAMTLVAIGTDLSTIRTAQTLELGLVGCIGK